MALTTPLRGDVYLVSLNPMPGRESQKTRLCLIVSPDELNLHRGPFLIAPMTSRGHDYPFRVPCRFRRKDGFVVLDQLRTVKRSQLGKRLGRVAEPTQSRVLSVLREMFAD